jgi:hypothetical protein
MKSRQASRLSLRIISAEDSERQDGCQALSERYYEWVELRRSRGRR